MASPFFSRRPRRRASWRFCAIFDIDATLSTGHLQIINPNAVAKVERLTKATGWTKTAVVDRAVDRLACEIIGVAGKERVAAILAQLERIPDRPGAFNPLDWDERGLPK